MAFNTPLALSGLILFLLGLLNGFLIPVGRSPRLGLSAHLTGVQSGAFLIAMGVVWPHIGIAGAWGAGLATALWVSMYAIWLSLLIAGLVGAGQGLPIAGGGITTTRLNQTVVTVLLRGGSLAATVAVAGILVAWLTHR